jgi:hypothetical protein
VKNVSKEGLFQANPMSLSFMTGQYHHNFFNIDKAAITRKAIPAHHKLPVRNQTMKATIAAGISTRSKRMINIIIKPMIIRTTSPNMS